MLGILSDVIIRTTLTRPADRARDHWDAPQYWRDAVGTPRYHLSDRGRRADD